MADNQPTLPQNNTQVTPFLLQPAQFPSGILQARMLAATPTQAYGDLYYSDGTNFIRLPAGTSGQVLTAGADGLLTWATPAAPPPPSNEVHSPPQENKPSSAPPQQVQSM